MKEWFSPAEIVAAKSPELPSTVRGLNLVIEREGWRGGNKARPAGGRGRANWEYHFSLLSTATQARLALLQPIPAPAVAEPRSSAIWTRFEGLSRAQKDECARRLAILQAVEQHAVAGLSISAAASKAATDAGTSAATVFNWRKLVKGIDRADWLAALAPSYRSTSAPCDCHPEFWDMVTSDWLRAEKPTFSSCYRRARKEASKNRWLPIPAERAMRRRVEADVPKGVVLLARDGRDKAKRLYPAQTRSRAHFHAMQAVNADGHKLDVFVRLDDGSVTRVHLVAMQDLYSGMIVAWRLSETENKDTVRQVIGDMVTNFGIPEMCLFDNGRSFASKWITGGMATRYRFKVRAEEPKGILLTLGVEVKFATPFHGQAKPIERAFRDLADTIAKHPICAGAYTGNRPDAKPENYGNAAIPFEVFRAHVAREIADHNERPGRRSEVCQGRSLRAAFEASMADPATIVRWPTEAQRALWLLAADNLRAERGSGEIRFNGNRYWSRELNQHAGGRVIVRFDPERLHDAIKVYTLDDRLICDASCIAPTGFDDAEKARSYQRDRKAHSRAVTEQLRLARKMSADELAQIYAGEPEHPQTAPTPPKIKRLAFGGGAPAVATQNDDFEESFSRGLRLIDGDADILPFTPIRKGG